MSIQIIQLYTCSLVWIVAKLHALTYMVNALQAPVPKVERGSCYACHSNQRMCVVVPCHVMPTTLTESGHGQIRDLPSRHRSLTITYQ